MGKRTNKLKKEQPIFNEDHVRQVREQNEKITIGEHELTPEEQAIYEKMLQEAKMPVAMTDDKFTLGENELDIRQLSKENKEQMMFRCAVLSNVYLKQILTSQTDIIRLLMVVCKKLGVDDITTEIDKIEEGLREYLINETKKNLN